MLLIAFGSQEIFLVLVIILVLFGGSRIPKLARGLGESLRAFNDGTNGATQIDAERPRATKVPNS